MDRTSTVIIGGLFFVGVIFFLALLFVSRERVSVSGTSSPAASNGDWTTTPAANPDGEVKEVAVTPKTVVTAKHAYRNGMHIIAGEVPLPTPCHALEAKATTTPDKKNVLVEISSSIKTEDMCAEVITPARFKVSIKAKESAKISATLNAQAITLNLIEAGPDEDLDNFELYIKG